MSANSEQAFGEAREAWRAALREHVLAPPDAGFSARLAGLAARPVGARKRAMRPTATDSNGRPQRGEPSRHTSCSRVPAGAGRRTFGNGSMRPWSSSTGSARAAASAPSPARTWSLRRLPQGSPPRSSGRIEPAGSCHRGGPAVDGPLPVSAPCRVPVGPGSRRGALLVDTVSVAQEQRSVYLLCNDPSGATHEPCPRYQPA